MLLIFNWPPNQLMGKTCTCNQEETKIIGKQALPLLALLGTKLRTNGSHPVHYIDTRSRYPNEECMHVQSTTSCPFQGYSFYTTLSALTTCILITGGWVGTSFHQSVCCYREWLAATCGLLSYKLAAITIKVGAQLQDEGPWFFTLFSREEPPYLHGYF